VCGGAKKKACVCFCLKAPRIKGEKKELSEGKDLSKGSEPRKGNPRACGADTLRYSSEKKGHLRGGK